MEYSGRNEHISQYEIDEAKEKILQLFASLNDAKEKHVRTIMGEEYYHKAVTIFEVAQNAGPEVELSVDEMLRLDEIDRETNAQLAYDILSLEPESEEDERQKMISEAIIANLYPDDTTPDLLDDREKLSHIGARLVGLYRDEGMHDRREIKDLSDARLSIDTIVTNYYNDAVSDDIEFVALEESKKGYILDIHINDISQEQLDEIFSRHDISASEKSEIIEGLSKSVTIKVEDDEFLLKRKTVTTKKQLDKVMEIIKPLPQIIKLLEELDI